MELDDVSTSSDASSSSLTMWVRRTFLSFFFFHILSLLLQSGSTTQLNVALLPSIVHPLKHALDAKCEGKMRFSGGGGRTELFTWTHKCERGGSRANRRRITGSSVWAKTRSGGFSPSMHAFSFRMHAPPTVQHWSPVPQHMNELPSLTLQTTGYTRRSISKTCTCTSPCVIVCHPLLEKYNPQHNLLTQTDNDWCRNETQHLNVTCKIIYFLFFFDYVWLNLHPF